MHQMVLLIGLLVAYFIPTMVADNRGHRQKLAIFAINLFLGWTLVGWVVALAWACTDSRAIVTAR